MKLEFNNPWTVEGVWLKGNLHAHTDRSDGMLTVEEVIEAYRGRGYRFLSITDHGMLTYPDERPRDILLIPGEEISVGTSSAGTRFHILTINVEEELPVEEGDPDESPQRVIDLTLRYGGLPIVAHPYWSGFNLQDLMSLKNYIGIEIYNTTCELNRQRGLSTVHWDGLLSNGWRLYGFAGDDAHMERRPGLPPDIGGAWIMVKAEEPTVEAVVDAISRGLFYSSNGPEIRGLDIGEGVIHVETSPVRWISFVSNPTLGLRYTAERGEITEAEFRVTGDETYIRIEVSDIYGRKAWTNPIYVEA